MSSVVTTKREAEPLTHSRLRSFRSCPRKHYLRYELGLRTDVESFPMRVGSAFARAVEADAKGLDVQASIEVGLDDPFDLALVAAMFDGHKRRWEGADLEHVAAELAFDLPLVNPETGRPSPIWRLQGVIDRLVRLPDGRLALMEYKTTSKDFAPGADYWTQLHLDMQLSIYLIAARALGYDVSTILYDVTRRPGQRPGTVPLVDENGSKIVHDGAGERVRTADGKKWRETGDTAKGYVLQTRPETPDEFAGRVAAAIAADPDKHFARIEIARLDSDLEEAQAEIWQQQIALREAQKIGRWYRNPEACFQINSACEYVGICQMRDLETRTPDGFKRVDDVHAELTRHAPGGGESPHATAGQAADFE